MARGFLSGALTGLVVSALGLGTASLLSEQPAGNTPPDAPQVEAPEVAVSEPQGDVPSVSGPGEGPGPSLGPAPDVDQPGVQTGAPLADTSSTGAPVATALEGGLEAPEAGENDVAVESETPVLPNPQASAPETPEAEADIVLSTEPAPEPVIVEEEPETEETGAETAADPDGADAAETDAPIVVDIVDEPSPIAPAEEDAREEAAPEEAAEATEEPAAEQPDDVASAEDTPALIPADPTERPVLQFEGEGNSLLTDRDTGVVIRRPGTDEEAPAETEDPAMPEAEPALVAYGAEASNPDGLPMMSIILLDDGSMSAASAALAGLAFPVTIAVDPGQEGAADLMQRYRDEGYEVAVLARVPEGATATDVEVTLEAIFAEFEQSVAVLDLGDGGFQSNPEATEQAMTVLAETGRGFVTVSQGLGSATRVADQAGVPAVEIYRDLDSNDQDAATIRRFVDQAAFRARQESGVVLVGRVRADTISALILWGTANRAGQVAQVPLSAVLLADE